MPLGTSCSTAHERHCGPLLFREPPLARRLAPRAVRQLVPSPKRLTLMGAGGYVLTGS